MTRVLVPFDKYNSFGTEDERTSYVSDLWKTATFTRNELRCKIINSITPLVSCQDVTAKQFLTLQDSGKKQVDEQVLQAVNKTPKPVNAVNSTQPANPAVNESPNTETERDATKKKSLKRTLPPNSEQLVSCLYVTANQFLFQQNASKKRTDKEVLQLVNETPKSVIEVKSTQPQNPVVNKSPSTEMDQGATQKKSLKRTLAPNSEQRAPPAKVPRIPPKVPDGHINWPGYFHIRVRQSLLYGVLQD